MNRNKAIKLRYNSVLVNKVMHKHNITDVALFYVLKSLFINSVIYDFNSLVIFKQIKELKIIPKNFSLNRFNRILARLKKSRLIYYVENDNHLHLTSVQFKSRNFVEHLLFFKNEFPTLQSVEDNLAKLFIKHKIYLQRKAIRLREKIDQFKKGKNNSKKSKLSKVEYDFLASHGETFYSEPIITFRDISNELGINPSKFFNITKRLAKQGTLILKKVVINHHLKVDKKFFTKEMFFDLTGLNNYFYVAKDDYLFSVLGSEVISIDKQQEYSGTPQAKRNSRLSLPLSINE